MNRIDLINNLKRKYGDTIPDILLHYEEVSSKLDEIENKDGLVEQLSTEKDNLHKKLTALSSNITKYRMNVAHQLELAIVSELKQLYMPDARFSFSFDTSEEFLLTGVDKVSILFNANKGEDLKPLAKIASGGEMSRVLLAIKMATNQKNLKETLIFDEVDEGVGGEVGRVIGEKLSQLGNATQIVVISHLPQVAAKANEHFLIEKRTVDERTVSSVRKLAHEERIDEIARMIYGDEKNEITRKQAEEMLKK
jgi:DNA repair protein RecN (Recombination protein N)